MTREMQMGLQNSEWSNILFDFTTPKKRYSPSSSNKEQWGEEMRIRYVRITS